MMSIRNLNCWRGVRRSRRLYKIQSLLRTLGMGICSWALQKLLRSGLSHPCLQFLLERGSSGDNGKHFKNRQLIAQSARELHLCPFLTMGYKTAPP